MNGQIVKSSPPHQCFQLSHTTLVDLQTLQLSDSELPYSTLPKNKNENMFWYFFLSFNIHLRFTIASIIYIYIEREIKLYHHKPVGFWLQECWISWRQKCPLCMTSVETVTENSKFNSVISAYVKSFLISFYMQKLYTKEQFTPLLRSDQPHCQEFILAICTNISNWFFDSPIRSWSSRKNFFDIIHFVFREREDR